MSLVLALPHLMLIPILVDLYLLLGPRISSTTITNRLGDWTRKQEGSSALEVADWLSELGNWDMSRLMAFLVPSVVDGLPQSAIFQPYSRGFLEPPLAVQLSAGAGFLLVGTALFVGFLVTLARAGGLVRADKPSIGRLIADRWLKFLGFTAVMIAIAAVGSMALVIPTVLLAAGGISAGAIVGFLSLGVLVLLVVTMFVPEAIVIDGAGPFRAIRSSATVVFTSFWQAIGLFIISLMFSAGLLSIWEEIAGDPVGLGIAIVVNAALITSLAIASLAFYRSRSDGFAATSRAV